THTQDVTDNTHTQDATDNTHTQDATDNTHTQDATDNTHTQATTHTNKHTPTTTHNTCSNKQQAEASHTQASHTQKITKHTPNADQENTQDKQIPQNQNPHTERTQNQNPHTERTQNQNPHTERTQNQNPHTERTQNQNTHTSRTQNQDPHTERTQNQEGSLESTGAPTHIHRERFEELYVKGELIGHGGYGSVYAGFRKTDSQPVALKFVDQRKIKMWAKMVVSALLHCHSRGVVHRDLKPENILVQLTNHNVLLLDFGSASVLKEGEYTDVAGTPEYLPPETVLRGEYFAVPATVWSLGILLFQMVWGDVPFYSDASIVKATLYFPRGISRDCRHLIRRCLAVSPDDRPTLEQIQQHPWMR
uniref:non-specific serine/threonine protein kinase n=1 Tax=Oncorhynchus tshawytscha TaxID=74940 RepID=A0AAZ3QAB9_ONCTS